MVLRLPPPQMDLQQQVELLQEENKRLRTTFGVEKAQLKQQLEQLQKEVTDCAAKMQVVLVRDKQRRESEQLRTLRAAMRNDACVQCEHCNATSSAAMIVSGGGVSSSVTSNGSRRWENATDADIPAITAEVDNLLAVITRLRKERAVSKARSGVSVTPGKQRDPIL